MLFDSIFSIFNEKGDKLKNATNSTSNEQTCKNSLKIQNVGSPSESLNNLTNVETPVSLIHSPSHEHQNNKVIFYFKNKYNV